MLVVGVGLREVAAGEDHAGDVLVEQHVDVVGLGDTLGGPGAQHRGEAALGQRTRDHLSECREDRVLQLGQHQADQAGPLPAQLGWALVSEDVQRRQHGGAGRIGDSRLAVEHAADRRLAHSDVLGDLGQSACHSASVMHESASGLHWSRD